MKISRAVHKIALIHTGLGAESQVSCISAKAVASALDSLKRSYIMVSADEHLPVKLAELQPACAFLAVHGKYAEDGLVQALCEYLKIPYTGSGVMASALCMNKTFFKSYIDLHSIPAPDYQSFDLKKQSAEQAAKALQIPLPAVIKPSREGSSLGVSICHKPQDIKPALEKAKKYDTQILAEAYIEGMELACSFLDGKVLSPVEIQPKTGFYDYNNKYTAGATNYILPARLPEAVIEECRQVTMKVQKLLNISNYGRADFIIQNNKKPLLLEVNTLPGLTEHSLLPKSAQYDGINFPQLIEKILEGAGLDYAGLC